MFDWKYFQFALKYAYHELKSVTVRLVAAEYLHLRSLQFSSMITKVVAHVAKLMSFSWTRDFPLFIKSYSHYRGPGSSVGIATDYGLDGPGSNPGWDEILRPSRPALGPTQPPVKWVPDLSRG